MIYVYILLLRIVGYLEGTPKIIAFLIVFSLMSYSTGKRIPLKELHKISKYNFYAILISLSMIVHGFIFGKVMVRDIAVLLSFWIWLVFSYTYFKDKTISQCLKFVLISFLIFNIANYIIFKLFFGAQKIGINNTMSMFGVFGYRIYFPLASGANVFAAQLAFNCLIVLYFIKTSANKYLYILIYAFYIMMLVLADSRLLLFLATIFSFIYWFSLNTLITFFKKFWWAIGIGLFAFLYVFYNTNLFDSFKRAGELEGRALSRVKIWGIAKEVIFSDYHFLTGRGLNGFAEGMPESFKKTFHGQHLQTSHNFLIQTIIDFGVLGVIIILYLIFEILKMVLKLKSSIINVLIIMILLIGVTESIPSFYSTEPTLFFIAILSIILTHYERENTGIFKSSDVLS